jgi:hypothetical protein
LAGDVRSRPADLVPVSQEAFVQEYSARMASWRPASMKASRVVVTSDGSDGRTTFVLQPDGSFTLVEKSKSSESRVVCVRSGECYFRFSPKKPWIWVDAPDQVKEIRSGMKATIKAVQRPRPIDTVTVPPLAFYRDVDTFVAEYANEDRSELFRTTITFGPKEIHFTEAVSGENTVHVSLQAQRPTRIPMPVSGPCAPQCADRRR